MKFVNTCVIPNKTCCLCFPTIDDHASPNSWKLIYSWTSQSIVTILFEYCHIGCEDANVQIIPNMKKVRYTYLIFLCVCSSQVTPNDESKKNLYMLLASYIYSINFFPTIGGHASPSSSCKLIRSLFLFATL